MISGVEFSKLTKAELLQLTMAEIGRNLTKDELEMIFKACDAFWIHPEERNPQAPHAILTKGKHSTAYINCPKVLTRSNLCQIMADQLLSLFLYRHNYPRVGWVLGSDSSALGLSKDMANISGARWHPLQKGPNKTQIWEKMIIPLGEKVLHIEELVTTGSTTQAVRTGIRQGNKHEVDFIPVIPVLVHRPDQNTPSIVDGSKYLPLLQYSIYTVDPEVEECPMCKNGSPALSAKENWDELIATM